MQANKNPVHSGAHAHVWCRVWCPSRVRRMAPPVRWGSTMRVCLHFMFTDIVICEGGASPDAMHIRRALRSDVAFNASEPTVAPSGAVQPAFAIERCVFIRERAAGVWQNTLTEAPALSHGVCANVRGLRPCPCLLFATMLSTSFSMAAGMYAVLPYALAKVACELPYILIQVLAVTERRCVALCSAPRLARRRLHLLAGCPAGCRMCRQRLLAASESGPQHLACTVTLTI